MMSLQEEYLGKANQQVNHSFRALAQAVAAFIVQQRNVAHMLRHSETPSPSTRAASLDHGARHDMDRRLHR